MLNALFFEDNIADYYPGDIFGEIYKDKIYQPYLTGKKDLVILDIGANLGWTAQYFAQFAKVVYAVEPSKKHAEIIQELLLHNRLGNVKLVQAAISSEIGSKTLYHNKNKTMYSLSGMVNDKTSEPEQIKTTTLEKLMVDNKIDHVDFMKLDTEGEEASILCSDSFRRIAPKIDCFVFEYHTWSGRNIQQIRTTLKDLGFDFAQLPTQATCFVCSRIK